MVCGLNSHNNFSIGVSIISISKLIKTTIEKCNIMILGTNEKWTKFGSIWSDDANSYFSLIVWVNGADDISIKMDISLTQKKTFTKKITHLKQSHNWPIPISICYTLILLVEASLSPIIIELLNFLFSPFDSVSLQHSQCLNTFLNTLTALTFPMTISEK